MYSLRNVQQLLRLAYGLLLMLHLVTHAKEKQYLISRKNHTLTFHEHFLNTKPLVIYGGASFNAFTRVESFCPFWQKIREYTKYRSIWNQNIVTNICIWELEFFTAQTIYVCIVKGREQRLRPSTGYKWNMFFSSFSFKNVSAVIPFHSCNFILWCDSFSKY